MGKKRRIILNNLCITGNLVRTPESKTTPQGVAVCTFSVAVKGNFSKDAVNYINVVTWRKLAEVCGQYLSKGKKVGITGEITSRSYEGKDGKKVYVTECVADKVEFLSPMGEKQVPSEAMGAMNPTGVSTPAQGTFTPVNKDSLPF